MSCFFADVDPSYFRNCDAVVWELRSYTFGFFGPRTKIQSGLQLAGLGEPELSTHRSNGGMVSGAPSSRWQDHRGMYRDNVCRDKRE